MSTTPVSFGDVGNLTTQIRSQGMGVVADALTSLQNQTNQSLSYILSQISTSVAATRPAPTPGSNPIAPYADLPTGFAISNVRYSTNAQGQQTLKMDAVWTPPSDPKYGGSYIIMQKPSDIAPTTRMDLNAGKSATLVFNDFPAATENWQFWLVSQNTTGQLNTSLTAPISGTPTVTVSVTAPPLGSSGIEYTSNVSVGVVAVNATNTAEGTVQQYISAGFTAPSDPSWGGVEIRIYYGGNLLAKNKSAISPITVNINNPSGNVTYTWKLVSYDVNGHSNTETGCPTGTLPVGSISGSFSTGFINAAIADIININASNITVGSLTAVTVKVTNAGGSGVVTDITQANDTLFGGYTGLIIHNGASPNQRVSIGDNKIFIVDSSNVNCGDFTQFTGAGTLRLYKNVLGLSDEVVAVDAGGAGLNAISIYTAGLAGGAGIVLGSDGSGNGSVAIQLGGIHRYAPLVNANGKRMEWGSTGNFNGGTPAQATVSTGLTAVESFTVTVVGASGTPEYAMAVGASGGSITFESSRAGSTSAFNWKAFGA